MQGREHCLSLREPWKCFGKATNNPGSGDFSGVTGPSKYCIRLFSQSDEGTMPCRQVAGAVTLKINCVSTGAADCAAIAHYPSEVSGGCGTLTSGGAQGTAVAAAADYLKNGGMTNA